MEDTSTMATKSLSQPPVMTSRQVLARLRKSFEESRKRQIKAEQSQIEFAKMMLSHAKKNRGVWYMQKAYRSAPCCPKCGKFVSGGISYCTVCGTRLIVIDLYPRKVKKTRRTCKP